MAIVTVRPDETLANGTWSVVPSGTRHGVTADDSDATYIRDATAMGSPTAAVWLGFPEPSIPVGSVLKEVRLRTRLSKETNTNWVDVRLTAIDWIETWAAAVLVSNLSPITSTPIQGVRPSDLSNLRAILQLRSTQFAQTPMRCQELFLDAIHVPQPEATVLEPTGTITDTNLPVVRWGREYDQHGGDPTHYEVKVFTAAQVADGGFDENTTTPIVGSGIVADGVDSFAIFGRDADGEPLDDGNYVSFVRIGQTGPWGFVHWSDWDSEAFTVDVPNPPAYEALAEADNSRARIRIAPGDETSGGSTDTHYIQVQRSQPGWNGQAETWDGEPIRTMHGDGLVAAAPFADLDNGSFETDLTGWSNFGGVFTRTDTWSTDGDWSASIAGGVAITTPTIDPMPIGEEIGLSLDVNVTGTGEVILAFLDDGDTIGGEQREVAAGISHLLLDARVPEGTDEVAVIVAADAGSTVLFDDVHLRLVVHDYEQPNGQEAHYRIRSVHDFGVTRSFSQWEYIGVVTPLFWQSNDYWWVKHAALPSLNLKIPRARIFSQPGETRPIRQGRHQVLGRADLVITTDVRQRPEGELVVELEDPEQEALAALLQFGATLLIQAPPGDRWPDRWCSIADQGTAPPVDKLEVTDTHETLPWTAVRRPPGNLGE